MRKTKIFKIYKGIQLILFIILMVAGVYWIKTNPDIFSGGAVNTGVSTLRIYLSIVLGLSVIFLVIDFFFCVAFEKKEGKSGVALPIPTGLGSRSDCDAIIEKYLDKPLPENVGCIMLELTNLKEINQAYGHLQGNQLIRDFSVFLQAASSDLCFVGRNGGNKFLAIFEDCDFEKIKSFLELLDKKVDKHNKLPDIHPIQFRFGIAFDEGGKVQTISDLIVLSDKRINNV